ncbi:MAG TPA: TPM domain-containing protein [Xanthobacteraceae bacterium]|nr:TPM domain-containing protein [Xanthobacteraceae bacterium]
MRTILAILALLGAVPAPSFAQTPQVFVPATAEFPALTGRVVDDAGVLDNATREALRAKLQALEGKTGDQLVVVTVKSLHGSAVEDYANRLFRHWHLGEKGRNNGVLFLHAVSERKLRIEVGYGLEATLTDAISKLILLNAVTPRFKANDFNGGTMRGVDAIIAVLSGDESLRHEAAAKPEPRGDGPGISLFPLTMLLLMGALLLSFVVISGLHLIHAILVALGLAQRRPRKGFWHGVERLTPASAASGASRSASRSGSSSSTSSSSGSSDSFSGGGGGDSGGGGASSDY